MPAMMNENEREPPETFNSKEIFETFDGKIVLMNGSTLLMADDEGNNTFHTLASDAKLAADGQLCRAEDLKPGTKIRVTTNRTLNLATKIESFF